MTGKVEVDHWGQLRETDWRELNEAEKQTSQDLMAPLREQREELSRESEASTKGSNRQRENRTNMLVNEVTTCALNSALASLPMLREGEVMEGDNGHQEGGHDVTLSWARRAFFRMGEMAAAWAGRGSGVA